MKFSLFILLAVAPLLQSATVDATSEISAVTVYSDRARVTRAASVGVPGGDNVIRFRGLPDDLDDSSLQAGGSGAEMKILGVEIRRVFSEAVVNDRVRELETQLQALSDSEKDIAAKGTDTREQRQFLQKVRDGLVLSGSSDGKTPPQGLDKIKPLYDFYSAELSTLSKTALALEVASRELQPKRKLLQEELSRLQGSRGKTEKEVLVAIQAKSAASAQITLSYNMRNASWLPLYDARVNTRSGEIDLAYYGIVRQQTGENWQNVKLALSTARPSVGARMPELGSWWVRFVEPVGYSESSKALDRSLMLSNSFQPQALIAGGKVTAAEPAADLDYQTATIDNQGVSTVFEIKIPASIPSDGETHQVAVMTQKLEGTLEYVATPKLSDQAYLRTRLTNSSGAPILGGKVNLFRDGDFVGQSHVNFIAAGAGFDFYLGVDDGVKIAYKMLVDKGSEGGLIQKRKDLTRKYEITVENYKAQPVKVSIFDQLPVSQDEAIIVSNVKFSDTPTKQEKDTGKLTWEFSLEPKAKKVLTEEFRVEWPADKQVGGL